jgi:hypothetical protein
LEFLLGPGDSVDGVVLEAEFLEGSNLCEFDVSVVEFSNTANTSGGVIEVVTGGFHFQFSEPDFHHNLDLPAIFEDEFHDSLSTNPEHGSYR